MPMFDEYGVKGLKHDAERHSNFDQALVAYTLRTFLIAPCVLRLRCIHYIIPDTAYACRRSYDLLCSQAS
ncbi:unnamed protein product [Dibothriocephalus latus]|uniref:Uncharacterized protein n=1 Tax=Dibothriocephalus latus TaxID=60516 RepID=A0A3P7NCI2_DIBLA|nr:unnamed protein product [Dibothriocephalus latus]